VTEVYLRDDQADDLSFSQLQAPTMGPGGLVHGQLLQHVRQHERQVQSYRILRKGRRVPGLAYQAIRQNLMMYGLELGDAGLTVCGSPYIMTLYEIVFAVCFGLGHGEPFLMSLLWRSPSPRTCLENEGVGLLMLGF
jgi:hypothetical protein